MIRSCFPLGFLSLGRGWIPKGSIIAYFVVKRRKRATIIICENERTATYSNSSRERKKMKLDREKLIIRTLYTESILQTLIGVSVLIFFSFLAILAIDKSSLISR